MDHRSSHRYSIESRCVAITMVAPEPTLEVEPRTQDHASSVRTCPLYVIGCKLILEQFLRAKWGK